MPTRGHVASAAALTAVVRRRLNALKPLSPAQLQRLEVLAERAEVVAPGTLIHGEGGGALRSGFILAGWAGRQRLLSDGRRQIFSLLIPGDAIGFRVEPSPISSLSAVALTKVVLAHADPLTVGANPSAPHFSGAHDPWAFADHMRRSAYLEDELLLGHVVRLGRQTAYERTAHLLLELYWRWALVGQVDDRKFVMPLTQEVLADVLGLSVVHVNRTLQQLRRERLIEVTGSQVALLDAGQLAVLADYQPPSLPRPV
jgi:CRP-like cAMP-binding protein